MVWPAGFAAALAATPMDHYVIWTGQPFAGRRGSTCDRVLAPISAPWRPWGLRELVIEAARLDPPVSATSVREAIAQHQTCRKVAHLLVRRLADGSFRLVARAPWPACHDAPLSAGALILEGQACLAIRSL